MPELPVLDFFYEIVCPFCRRVRVDIIEKIRPKDIVVLNLIDVDANTGSVEMDWYRGFCREVKEDDPTPVIRLHDKLTGENNWEAVFLMWKKKPDTITQEVLTSEEYLEKQIYDELRLMADMQVVEVQPSYELERDLFFARRKRPDARVY